MAHLRARSIGLCYRKPKMSVSKVAEILIFVVASCPALVGLFCNTQARSSYTTQAAAQEASCRIVGFCRAMPQDCLE